MERITPVNLQNVQGRAKELLDAVKAKLGIVPNMTRSMAVSPPVLEAYLGFSGALGHGVLPARVREQLALDIGEANHCDYCVSAHSAIGKRRRAERPGHPRQPARNVRRPEERRAAPLRPDGVGEEGSGRGCRHRRRAGCRLRGRRDRRGRGPRRPERLHELLQQRRRHGHRLPESTGTFRLSYRTGTACPSRQAVSPEGFPCGSIRATSPSPPP